jgi:hypothetical protein
MEVHESPRFPESTLRDRVRVIGCGTHRRGIYEIRDTQDKV